MVRSAIQNSLCGAPKDGRERNKAGGKEVTMVQRWRGEHRQPEKGGQGKDKRELKPKVLAQVHQAVVEGNMEVRV